MSKYEERTYRVGKKRPSIADMKGQRERLRQDLEQFTARKPAAAVIASLRERIKALDLEIAEAEAERKRDRPAPIGDDEPDGVGNTESGAQAGLRATSSRFPPRGRPGR